MANRKDEVLKQGVNFEEIGRTGLEHTAGEIFEEKLRALQKSRRHLTWMEMSDNDATVGAILFVIDMLIRQVEWKVIEASKNSEDIAAAEFLKECMQDMDQPFQEVISEIMSSMLPHGFAPLEMVFKKRLGNRDPFAPIDPEALPPSRFDDGRIGWHKLALRAPETIDRWKFSEAGDILGLVQKAPPDYKDVDIDMWKLLLFRTSTKKNNPEGRALALDTPIPTPNGWRTMGDLLPGDQIFDERGKVRHVVAKSDIWTNRPCYKVNFSDGSHIIADENHLWSTQLLHERSSGKVSRIRTTKEIFQTQKNSAGVSNHSIDWHGPLQYPEQAQFIDPYLLGLWLGDGHSRSASITCHVQDLEQTENLITACGYKNMTVVNGQKDGNGRLIRVYSDIQSKLRVMGLLHNKHIPDSYLRGSERQRIALLQGLMDSDGTVDAWGRCEFTNTNRTLIDGVSELVRSLGATCSIKKNKKSRSGKGSKLESWDVAFTPSGLFKPFRLDRKLSKLKDVRSRTKHYITSIEQIEPRDTVCIEVDSPSHLFLAGRSMVPTHNSILRTAYRSWFFKKKIENIEAIGIERDLAGLPFAKVPSEIMNPNADNNKKAIYEKVKKIVINLRRDEQEGIVFPNDRDENGNPLFELSLLSTGGSRQFKTSETINRYRQDIAMTVLADFILVGHEMTGSFSMHSSKTGIFTMALKAWLEMIASVFNRKAIPMLFWANSFNVESLPQITFGDIETIDLQTLAAYITALSGAGIDLTEEGIANYLKSQANIPSTSQDEEI